MKLTNKALNAIRESGALKSKLALELKVSEASIRNYIRDNDEDGELTKISALHVIADETGMSQEEILQAA